MGRRAHRSDADHQAGALNGITMMKYILASSVISALLLVVMIMSFDSLCSVFTTGTTRTATERLPEAGPAENAASHCLIYGKYCMTDALRGRQER